MADRGIPTIILCGGRGTRISEVNPLLPKPMLAIGERPVLWHIMKTFAAHGHCDFYLALGWLGDQIRRFFLDYEALANDFTVELGVQRAVQFHAPHPEDGWRISCIDTGLTALTGTRVRRVLDRIPDGPVLVTYGDSVGDVDIGALLDHHRACGRLATITAVHPPGRFGELLLDGDSVREFQEKPQTSVGAINGGFMVFEREAIERYVPEEDVMLEREPLSALAADGQLAAYRHEGFWQPMDTPRELALLTELWESGSAPWKVWDES